MDVPNLDTLIYPHTTGEHSYYTSVVTQENVVYEMAIDLVKVEANNQEIWNFHKCKMCPYKTKSFHLMRSHLKRHRVTRTSKLFNCQSGTVELYKCSNCDYRTALLIMFNKHVKMSHCHPEPKNEDGYPNILTNMVSCNWRNCNKAYSCENCTFTTYSQLLYVSHYRRCPVKKFVQEQMENKGDEEVYGYIQVYYPPQPEETIFPCTMCSYVARRRTTLDGHMKVKHPFPKYNFSVTKYRRQSCTLCPFKTRYYHCLKRHYRLKHPIPIETEPPPEVPSPVVAEPLEPLDEPLSPEESEPEPPPRPNRAKIIPSKRTKGKLYSCWKCSFKSAHVTGYVNHVYHRHLNDNDIDWLKCDQCAYKTIFLPHLKRHLRMKHRSKYDCSLCKFSTTMLPKFRKHVLHAHISAAPKVAATSPKKKNFKCYSCSFQTVDNEALKQHILNRHVTTETVTCFKCELCKYRTIDEEVLKVHVLEKHVDPQQTDWFPCEMCSCNFRQRVDLKKHIMEKHIL